MPVSVPDHVQPRPREFFGPAGQRRVEPGLFFEFPRQPYGEGTPLAQLAYRAIQQPKGTQYNKYKIVKLSSFDERVDELWRQTRQIAPIAVRRDSNYLNWRYFAHPHWDYSVLAIEDGEALLGYTVIRIQELAGLKTGFITDLLVNPGAKYAPDALIEAAVSHSEAEGCELAEGPSRRLLGHLDGWGRGLGDGSGALYYPYGRGSTGTARASVVIRGRGKVTATVRSCRIGAVHTAIDLA